jgi:hypothetical protein
MQYTTEIQGVPKVLTWFCETISREPLGLQKWHRRQKMRLILKLCFVFYKCRISYVCAKFGPIYEKKFFRPIFFRYCVNYLKFLNQQINVDNGNHANELTLPISLFCSLSLSLSHTHTLSLSLSFYIEHCARERERKREREKERERERERERREREKRQRVERKREREREREKERKIIAIICQ